MTREQRTNVFRYWLSAVEVCDFYFSNQILATCFYFPDSILDVVFIVSSEPAECLSSKPRPTGIGAFSSSRADGTGGESSTAGRDARNVISTVFSSVSPPLF